MLTDNERIAKFMGWKSGMVKYTKWDWLMPVCIKLGMTQVTTDINEAYKTVVYEIGRRSLDVNS